MGCWREAWSVVAAVLLLAVSPPERASAQTPQGTAFTYQGQLSDGGSPANGSYDFQLILYDAAVGGSQVGPIVTHDDVAVTGGLFTLSLDFGAVFVGSKRWLELGVRPGTDPGPYNPLAPRQELAPAPAASFSAATPWTGVSGKPPGFADDVDDDVVGGLSCASGELAKWNGTAWGCAADADSGGTVTSLTAGSGLTGGTVTTAGTFAVDYAGSGSAASVSRSDHDHLGQVWSGNTGASPGLSIESSTYWAIYGRALTTAGGIPAIYGQSAAVDEGYGVLGYASAAAGSTFGVKGQANSSFGKGVYGLATSMSGSTYGVMGYSGSSIGYGVWGGSSAAGPSHGVHGETFSPTGYGVYGWAAASSGTPYAIYGTTQSPAGYAGYFAGRVHVTGILSKGGGSFKIDHPLDPENKYLYHSFVESPDMKNIYDGLVTTDGDGYATVELPEWFGPLNRDFRYQLTVIGDGAWARARVYREIADNRFVIQTDAPDTRVSWQVTGIRQDRFAEAHRIPVEQDKPEDERGLYLHPESWGQPKEKGIDDRRLPKEATAEPVSGGKGVKVVP